MRPRLEPLPLRNQRLQKPPFLWHVPRARHGAVPYYHSYFERLNPADFDLHLKHFTTDKHQPPTILLEFLPGVEELNCASYSEGRFEKAVRALGEVHRALVQH